MMCPFSRNYAVCARDNYFRLNLVACAKNIVENPLDMVVEERSAYILIKRRVTDIARRTPVEELLAAFCN